LQQLETIQRSIEPLQDAILRLSKVAATVTNEATLQEINASLDEFRKTDKELRERLFVVQVARKYDWEAANKMARRKAGAFNDPELTKVLEEREKKEEKAKRIKEKERSRSLTPSHFKRGRFSSGSYSPSYARGSHQGYSSPLASAYPQEQRPRSGYGHAPYTGFRRPNTDDACYICNQKGHQWRACPSKK
jgi:hypothetical protein